MRVRHHLACYCLLLYHILVSSPLRVRAAPGSVQVRVAVDGKSQPGSSPERSEFVVRLGWDYFDDTDARREKLTQRLGWIEQLDSSVVGSVTPGHNVSERCRALGVRIGKSALHELLLDQVVDRPPARVWFCGFDGEAPSDWGPCLDGISCAMDDSQHCPQSASTVDIRLFVTEPLERPPPSDGSFLSADGARVDDKPVAWVELEAEANAWARAIPLLADILAPVIDEVMEPIVNPVVNMMAPALGEDFQEMFQQECVGFVVVALLYVLRFLQHKKRLARL